jgi:F0F1-type ATP synthase membrane subunit b/b'
MKLNKDNLIGVIIGFIVLVIFAIYLTSKQTTKAIAQTAQLVSSLTSLL